MSWVGKSVLLPMSTCSVPLGLRGLKVSRLSKSGGINLKLAGSSLTRMGTALNLAIGVSLVEGGLFETIMGFGLKASPVLLRYPLVLMLNYGL